MATQESNGRPLSSSTFASLADLMAGNPSAFIDALSRLMTKDQAAELYQLVCASVIPLDWTIEELAGKVIDTVKLAYPEEGPKPPLKSARKYAFLEHSIVVLEGLIAVGKSFMTEKMAGILAEEGGITVHIFPEPAPSKLLQLFYDHLGHKPRNPYGFSTQVFFSTVRSNTNNEAQAHAGKISTYPVDDGSSHVSITDRSRVGDLVFVITNAMLGSINGPEVEALLEMAMIRNTFQFDFLVYLDSSARRAERIMKTVRRREAEKDTPLWYLEKLRLVYYVVLRELGMRGSRILYVFTPDDEEVWTTAAQVLSGLSACPSTERCKEIWGAGPKITWDSSAEEVDRALAVVRKGYRTVVTSE